MGENAGKGIKLIAALVLLVGAVGWAVSKSNSLKPDQSVNNGVNSTVPLPPASAMKAMNKMQQEGRMPVPDKWSDRDMSDPDEREAVRAEMEKKMTEEEKAAVREAMVEMNRKMTTMRSMLGPEQTREMNKVMRERMQMMRNQRGGGARNDQ